MIHKSQSLETQPKSNPPASVKAASLCDSPAPLISLLSESKGDSSAYFPYSLVPDQSPDAFVVSSSHGMKWGLQLNKWATNPSPLLPLNIKAIWHPSTIRVLISIAASFLSHGQGKRLIQAHQGWLVEQLIKVPVKRKETIPVVLQFRSNDSNITLLYD